MQEDRLVQIGDIIDGEVIDFASGGEGIIKLGAYPVFVPFAIVGESVKARINYAKKDCAFADLIEVLSPSNDRIKPKCPYYGRCGGCDLQHINYSKQLDIKRLNVERALRKVGGIDTPINHTVSVNEWEYRNKLALPFGYRAKSNRVVLGFYEKMSHSVVPMKWCALHGEWCAHLIEDVTDWANECSVSVYNETTKKGVLRHLVARYIDTLTITLSINAQRVDNLSVLVDKLNRHFKDYTIYISAHTRSGNAILGDDVRLVYGSDIKQNLGAYSAIISPLSFLQVNNDMRDRIYDDVCAVLQGFDGDIIELYSGVGLLTAQIAKRLSSVHITSCEIVPSAVENAKTLMKDVGVDDRVECVCDDATNFVKSLAHHEKSIDLPSEITLSPLYLGEQCKSRALILDPPRKGCDEKVLRESINAGFERIIYISCNPQTLARDLKIIKEAYDIISITPYDMFPQTRHVETFVSLKQKVSK